MSFQITEFTSYADVRAALGVSEDDLEDETLELDLYADMLEVEFEDVSATFLTTYAAAQATDTPTEAQARFLKEMDSVLLDEPRLAADRLAGLLAARGKKPPEPQADE